MSAPLRRRLLCSLLALAIVAGGAGGWALTQGGALEEALLRQISASLRTRGHITEIELNLWDDFPRISLSMRGVWLEGSGSGGPGAGPFSGDTLLRADRLGLTLDAWSLLGEQPRIEALSVEGATLVLAKRSDGSWNADVWKVADGPSAFAIVIDRLALDDVWVQVSEAGGRIEDAVCTGEFADGAVEADAKGNIFAMGQRVAIRGHIAQAGDRWQATDLKVVALGAALSGEASVEQGKPALSLEVSGLKWSEIEAAAGLARDDRWQFAGEFGGKVSWDGTTWKGQARCTNGDLLLPEGIAPWWEAAAADPVSIGCTGTAWFRYREGDWRVDVPQLTVEAAGAEATGEVTWDAQQLSWSGPFRAGPEANWALPPSTLDWTRGTLAGDLDVKWHNTGWAGQARLTGSSLAGTWAGQPWNADFQAEVNREFFAASDVQLALNSGTWRGGGRLERPFDGAAMVARLDAATGRWVAPEGEGSGEGPWWEALNLPPGSRIDAKVHVDTLLWEGNVALNARFDAAVEPQRVAFSGEVEPWGGDCSFEGEARWNERGARLDLDYTAAEVDVQTLFAQMANFGQTTLRSEHVSGTLASTGSASAPWLASGTLDESGIQWNGEIHLKDGSLTGVEALMSIPDYLSEHRLAAPLISPADLREKLNNIALEPVSVVSDFTTGWFHILPAELQSENLHVSLQGAQSLSGELDYSLGIELRELREQASDDIGVVEDDGLGNQLFISIKGSTEAPEFAWDRNAQRAHRRNNLREERDKLKELLNVPE